MLKRSIKAAVKTITRACGYTIVNTRKHYAEDGLITLHDDRVLHDPAFRRAYARGVQASRGVDPGMAWRIHVAVWAAQMALRVPGYFVECGVNAGFVSSAIMDYLDWNSTGRVFYLIDTFAGPVLSQYSDREVQEGRLRIAQEALAAGAYVTDMERVRANFAEWPSATVVQGAVPEALSILENGVAGGATAFLHIDLNCAYPERAALEFFWPRLSPGAVVLLDDYSYLGQRNQAEAIDEAARQWDAHVLSLPTGQGLLIR
jgi:hypothetical protein